MLANPAQNYPSTGFHQTECHPASQGSVLPTYMVIKPSSWSSNFWVGVPGGEKKMFCGTIRPRISLHLGPSDTGPEVAHIVKSNKKTNTIIVCPVPAGTSPQPVTVDLVGQRSDDLSFTMQIGPGGRPESFRWSKGCSLMSSEIILTGTSTGEVLAKGKTGERSFNFCNSAAAGRLGETWEVVALMSFLKLRHLKNYGSGSDQQQISAALKLFSFGLGN